MLVFFLHNFGQTSKHLTFQKVRIIFFLKDGGSTHQSRRGITQYWTSYIYCHAIINHLFFERSITIGWQQENQQIGWSNATTYNTINTIA